MEYNQIAAAVRLCGTTPKVDKCKAECPYYCGPDMMQCIPRMTEDAAQAITDLLARAEAAEKRAEEAETENKDREEASFREHADTHYWRDRAREAEADRDRLREALKPNCLLCDSMHENGNCTEVGGFCTAVPASHCPLIPRLRDQLTTTEARAEEAEKCIYAIEDDLDRGNDNDWAREHIAEWKGQKEERA